MSGLIIGVDGGGSKTHAIALTIDGELAGRGDGPGSSPHFHGVPQSIEIVDAAVRAAIAAASGTPASVIQANLYLSGLDLPPELEAYADAAAALTWTPPTTVVDNDLFALLRTGTESPDAVAVVCGTGINAIGVRSARDGEPAATARFAALGPISGDWGGGSGLGEEALWHAARAEDGRGPRDGVARRRARRDGCRDRRRADGGHPLRSPHDGRSGRARARGDGRGSRGG